MEGVLNGRDALDAPTGDAEIGHGLDDWPFEPSLELVQQALLDLLVFNAQLLLFLLIDKQLLEEGERVVILAAPVNGPDVFFVEGEDGHLA